MRGVEGRCAFFLELILACDEGHGGLITFFRLAGDETHGFVQKYGHTLLLFRLGVPIEGNFLIG